MIRTTFKSMLVLMLLGSSFFAQAQKVPTPKEHFGFNIGDDYQLASFVQTEAYFKKLASTSDRLKYTVIGKTEEGRDQPMLIISSPANLQQLAKYQEISQKLARAEGITPETARVLAKDGKAVVWIDGGLHANEVLGAHQLIETAYQLTTRTDEETMRILDRVIILMTHANPDGQDLVTNWYMKESDPKKRSTGNLPRLYQKYIGHDNNRDFYMLNTKEAQNIGRQLFVDWLPQIMYNHHQTAPTGAVVAGAPYRDPFNYVFDPLLMTGIDALGAAMANRLNAEGKTGYTARNGAVFSTWYNGGLRTTTYFHNIIGLLTETIGSPTPMEIPVVTTRLIPDGNTTNPVTPQKWHFRQSIDYSVSMNYAVLGYAQRHCDELLYNIYRMGLNSIERGSKDFWALSPSKIDAINTKAEAEKPANAPAPAPGNFRGMRYPSVDVYNAVMKDPARRDPRAYIISADQSDYATSVRFVNALINNGIQVHKATAGFTVNGKTYPAGSYVIKTSQAFRPHILDMMEPQDHPNDFRYPGGPPVPPYDAAGWTLAYQMGVEFDRILEGFDAPLAVLPWGVAEKATGKISGSGNGYILSAKENMSFLAVNQLLKSKINVVRITAGPEQGNFFVPAAGKAILEKASKDFGVTAKATSSKFTQTAKVQPSKIALWDVYGGSMPSGWVRWLLEQFQYDFDVVFAPTIDAGNLKSKYDVIVFVGGAIGLNLPDSKQSYQLPANDNITAAEKVNYGRLNKDKSIPAIRQFMQDGGTVVTIGSSTALAYHLELPVKNALVEIQNGKEVRLTNEKYYIPGSILEVDFDAAHPAVWGMKSKADVYFDNSAVFHVAPKSLADGSIQPLAWFSTATPLRSGWAWGQNYLQDGVTAFAANIGKGKLLAYGPEITFRAQPHGTFKLLFNQLYK
ncbi:M14 family metallopeptidase [Gynurincola endophyticus]|uniref:M14 family metallopeptidase n=1 Tax=Gynurincola endophyticus TaxID=2479004 RepID=UPI000F8F6DFA|nr:M14 metallopeptidase family protein [Gynurincola endophyticus]